MRRVLRLIRGKGLNYGLLLVAQVFTFGSSMWPIVSGAVSVLPEVVRAQAVATVLCYPATLSGQVILGDVVGSRQFRQALRISVASLCVWVGGFLLAAGVCSYWGSSRLGLNLLLFALSLAGSGVYAIALGVFTRLDNVSGVSVLRLSYGVVGFVLTVIVCAIHASAFGLVVASSAGYGVGIAVAVSKSGDLGAAVRGLGESNEEWLFRYSLSRGGAVAVGQLASTFASQMPAFVAPGLGALSGPWSAAIRIGSGFNTVGASVLAPSLNVRWLRAIHGSDWPGLRRVYREGLGAGVVLGAASGAAALGLFLVLSRHSGAPTRELVFASVGVIGLWGLRVMLSPVGQFLSYLRATRYVRVLLDWGVLLVCLLLVGFLKGLVQCLGLGVVLGVSGPLCFVLLWVGVLRTQELTPADEYIES